MRQIGSLDDADLAEHFVSFLIISGVDALSETAQRDGKPLYEIWIRDEDGIELARREMQAFLENPQEKKYLDALAEAKQLRKVREKRSKEAASLRRSMPRKSMPSGPGGRRDIGGITLLTGLIALFVTLATNFGSDRARVVRSDMSGEEGGLRLRIKASWTDRLMFVSWVDYKENNNDPLASIKQGEISTAP